MGKYIGALVFAVLLLTGFGVFQYNAIQGLEQQVASLQSEVYAAPVMQVAEPQDEDLSILVERLMPAVVTIKTDAATGSGVFVDTNGYVITNNHVLKDMHTGKVYLYNDESYGFKVIARDEKNDLALLKLNTDRKFPTLAFDDPANVKLGMKAIALGSPGGMDFSVATGIVSGLNRTKANGVKFVQIDMAINPGNSGGPLVNEQGLIIGINTLKSTKYESMGFALPTNTVKDFVDREIARQ
jgi:serine protease Do